LTDLISTIFDSFSEVIGGLAGGLQTAFSKLIYAEGSTDAFSPLVLFIFTMAGVSLAAGVLWKIFGLIRKSRRGA
jgi:hypothetical protein